MTSAAERPERQWPRLSVAESWRVQALLLLCALLLLPAAGQRIWPQAQLSPLEHCAQGALLTPDGVFCAADGHAQAAQNASPLTAWWMGRAMDINTADEASLTVVSGIGPKLAQRIVQDRAERGPFLAMADVQRVRGIGPKLAARLSAVCEVYATDQRSTKEPSNSKR